MTPEYYGHIGHIYKVAFLLPNRLLWPQATTFDKSQRGYSWSEVIIVCLFKVIKSKESGLVITAAFDEHDAFIWQQKLTILYSLLEIDIFNLLHNIGVKSW